MNLVKSVYNNDQEIIKAILDLHIKDDRFDIDPCFSSGKFYKGLNEPRLKFDIKPQRDDVIQLDVKDLEYYRFDEWKENRGFKSIIFDPPFMFGTHGQTKNNIMNKRFSMFDSFDELKQMYQNALYSFYSILDKGGVVAFKCQDYTDSKTTMTHCLVWQWAIEAGFYPKDIFIMATNNGRIYNPNLNQKHARKFHSYWWIFQK